MNVIGNIDFMHKMLCPGEIVSQLEDSRPVMAFTFGGEIADRVKAACRKCPSVKVCPKSNHKIFF